MKNKKLLANSVSLVLVLVITILLAVVSYTLVTGMGFGKVGGILLHGAFGNVNNVAESLLLATPMLTIAVGVIFAFKGGLWNIGAEGQMYMGAIMATFVALNLTLPGPLHMLVIFLASFAGGGLYALIPGFLKAKWKVNEILTTIMMNFLAIYLTHFLIYGPWRDTSISRPQTAMFPESAYLPIIIPGTRLHAGFIIAIVLVIVAFIVFKYTRLGYSISMMGANQKAARYGGINVFRTILITMFISGGMAGIAGMGLVSGIYHFLINSQYQISPGYGYYAIGVALLGGLTAPGTFGAAIIFGFLIGAASYLKTMSAMTSESLYLIVGLILIAVLARAMFSSQLQKLFEWRGGISKTKKESVLKSR